MRIVIFNSRKILIGTFLIITGLISSCFDFSESKFIDIGEGFEFGYYNGNRDLMNVYYNDGGLFPFVCTKVNWNKNYIIVTCKEENGQVLYFIVNKTEYMLNPIQFKSNGIAGPFNYESLIKTEIYKENYLIMNANSIP
ncbi:MAG: hypothetical protein JST10_16320 [Bacteroidetes bacterium]|nr:hypothetical protein [Bacteroidota bacterium]